MVITNNGKLPKPYKFQFVLESVQFGHHLPLVKFILKKTGEKCGGWFETKVESKMKNHLRWARVRVKGLLEKILASPIVTWHSHSQYG